MKNQGAADLAPPIRNQVLIRGHGRSRRPVLIFVGVAILVLGTLGYRVWKNRRLELPGIYERGRTEGIAALDAGQFDKAHQLLSAARSAVDSLGGAVEGADEVRQAAREAAIYVDLVSETLEDLVGEAARADPQSWDNRFKAFYAGHSVLIDARVTAIPPEEGDGAYEIDYLILPSGVPGRFAENGTVKPDWIGRIDLSNLTLFRQIQPSVGDHIVFGATLASCGFDSKTETWTVGFEPESGVLILHPSALSSLGWPTDSIDQDAETEEK
jgi:hypothetical protein